MCPACRMYVYLQLLVLFHLVVVTDCQAVSLPAPECYNTATCPCCKPGSCPSDGSGQCGGNCIDGYHDGKCRYRCPSNCVRCVDAPGLAGVATCTQCKDGYYFTSSQYQCQSCPSGCKTCASSTLCTGCKDGYYLADSKQCSTCPYACLTCNSMTFCTSCVSGYYLELDTGRCGECSTLCSSCTSRNSCICSNGCLQNECLNTDGTCVFGCNVNFMLEQCDTCTYGMYGDQCDKRCSKNCESTCERISGKCTACKPGYNGDYCDVPCPENCVSTCNRSTGNCIACMDGYHGNRCTLECQINCQECTIINGTCTTCIDGFYGDTCNKNCSEHCIINKCDKINGSCDCVAGYEGDTCQQKVTTTTTPRFPRDGLPLVVTPTPENYVGEAIGLTLASVVVIVAVIGGVIILYRRRKVCFRTENLPTVTFNARITDETKLKAELASIDEEIATLAERTNSAMERRVKVETQLQELDRQMPYRHTDRADVMTTDTAYEMLQRKQPDDCQGHYTTLKY